MNSPAALEARAAEALQAEAQRRTERELRYRRRHGRALLRIARKMAKLGALEKAPGERLFTSLGLDPQEAAPSYPHAQKALNPGLWKGRYDLLSSLGLRLGPRAAWERRIQRRAERRPWVPPLPCPAFGDSTFLDPHRYVRRHLEKRFGHIDKRLRLAGWRLARAHGLPTHLSATFLQVPPDSAKNVFSLLAGHARGWQAYGVETTLGPSAIEVKDMGRYSSRCSYHRMERYLFIQSYGICHGRTAVWHFHGQTLVAQAPPGYRWQIQHDTFVIASRKGAPLFRVMSPADFSSPRIRQLLVERAIQTIQPNPKSP